MQLINSLDANPQLLLRSLLLPPSSPFHLLPLFYLVFHIQITRVLKPTGVFIMCSYGIPDNRLSYLDNDPYHWKVQVHTVAKPTVSAAAVPDAKDASSVHYVYVCAKGAESDD